MYYSSNTFFLAPGPLKNSVDTLDKIQTRHFRMIKSMGVELDLQDLTPVVFKQIQSQYERYVKVYPRNRRSRATAANLGDIWGTLALDHLYIIWAQKLAFARRTKGLREVKIAIRHKAVVLDGSTLNYHLDGLRLYIDHHDYSKCSQEVLEFIQCAARAVHREIVGRFVLDGWRGIRTAVESGRFRSHNWGR